MDKTTLYRDVEVWRESGAWPFISYLALWNGYADEGPTRTKAIDNLAAQIDRQRERRERGES